VGGVMRSRLAARAEIPGDNCVISGPQTLEPPQGAPVCALSPPPERYTTHPTQKSSKLATQLAVGERHTGLAAIRCHVTGPVARAGRSASAH
jgi:hypothetical protein